MSGVLSYSQERFWFLHQVNPGCAYYHECVPARLRGPLNVCLLEACLAELVRRHQVLRSTFGSTGDAPTQFVRTRSGFVLPLVDLHGLPTRDRERTVEALALDCARRPFDLERELPIRALLLRCDDREHVLLLTLHHIVADTWSLGVMLSELQVLHNAWRDGAPSPLAEPPLQYADIATIERGAVLREHDIGYWREHLAGLPAELDLPADRPRVASPVSHGARERLELSAPLSAEIRALARRYGATVFMTLLAAFDVLLSRYAGASDIVVGSPIALRTRPGTEAMIGPLLNVLLLRVDLSGDPDFVELLARVKRTCVDAYSHRELPLQTVIRQTPELHGSQAHPFQVMFVLQNAPLPALRLGNLELKLLDLDKQSSVFDLDLQMWDDTEQLTGWLLYRTELFDGSTIRQLLEHFLTLLQGAVDDPTCPISQLPMLSRDEKHRQRVLWNATRVDAPAESCLHEFVEQQARATPDATAIVFRDQVVTYGALNRRANRLAHRLRAAGVGPDVLVGVVMKRSVELVVTLLAILKAGGAYLPLDPTDPADRRADLVAAAQPRLVVTDAGDDRALDDADPFTGVAADNLAYVIYTSGSTGVPKGVAIDHRAIVNRIAWMQREYRLDTSDRVLQKTPITFDVSVWELFWPLATGATLVVAEPDGHRDGGYLVEVIQRHGITTVHFVPSMLGAFVRTRTVDACRSLRRVFSSGEELSAQVAHEVANRLAVPLYNLYGPTEAAVDVTAWTCGPAEAFVPIGRPIANTQIYVLDPHGRFVPIGVRGELYIGGIQIARGYLGRPDLTAERFVPDALGDIPGRRMYRTGDLTRADATGALRFCGRLDRQIKWRGIRLEVRELELILERHPAVAQAVVDVVEGRLVAFIVGEAPADELKRFLRTRVPDAIIPTTIVILSHIPLLSSGKVDRTALVDALRGLDDGSEAATVAAPPRTELQQQMVDIWRVLLGRRQIGIDDNFFDLGGHSMLAVQFVNAMYARHGVDISVSLLFGSPTVSTLAEAVETALWAGNRQQSSLIAGNVEYEI